MDDSIYRVKLVWLNSRVWNNADSARKKIFLERLQTLAAFHTDMLRHYDSASEKTQDGRFTGAKADRKWMTIKPVVGALSQTDTVDRIMNEIREGSTFVVALSGNQIGGVTQFKEKNSKIISSIFTFVNPTLHRHKIWSQLVQLVFSYAKNNGFKRLEAHLLSPEIIAAYEKLGREKGITVGPRRVKVKNVKLSRVKVSPFLRSIGVRDKYHQVDRKAVVTFPPRPRTPNKRKLR